MFNMSDRTYDIIKWLVSVVLPAAAALYVAFGTMFGLPYGPEISGTVMGFVLLFGAVLQVNHLSWAVDRLAEYGSPILDKNRDDIPDYPFKMSGQLYDTLKWIALIGLPAVSTFYLALSKVWSLSLFPNFQLLVNAVVVFLVAILQFSSMKRNATMDREGVPR